MKQSIDYIPKTGNFTSRRLLASLTAASVLILPAACADTDKAPSAPAASTEVAPPSHETIHEAFDRERDRAKDAALKIADHLLDLMEDPRSHTETLDTGVEGIANKRYLVESNLAMNGNFPELRALYYPDSGMLYMLGVDGTKQGEDAIFDEAGIGFSIGTESRITLSDKLGHLTASDIRKAVFTADTELISLEGEDQWGFSKTAGESGKSAGIFFDDPTTTGRLSEQSKFGIGGDADSTVHPDTPSEIISGKTTIAIETAQAGSANLHIG
jgi:hypothetical protein